VLEPGSSELDAFDEPLASLVCEEIVDPLAPVGFDELVEVEPVPELDEAALPAVPVFPGFAAAAAGWTLARRFAAARRAGSCPEASWA
jgi:hypothetical protein